MMIEESEEKDLLGLGVEEIEEDLLPKEVMDALKATHGDDVTVLEIQRKPFAFRPPSRPEYKRYRDLSQRDGSDKEDLAMNLMATCCVHPDRQAILDHFQKWPMAVTSSFIAFGHANGMDYAALSLVK